MARLARLLSIVLTSLLSAFFFVGDLFVDVFRNDLPPLLDAGTSLHVDQVLRTSKADVADPSTAGVMFTEKARDHDRFIGDGFTNLGRSALPI